ncbi:MAG: hypothetical protein ACRD5Z_21875, partial [Bryobacteraceae bacterium]
RRALDSAERDSDAWQAVVADYDRETAQTFSRAQQMTKRGLLNFLADQRHQYDPHSQVILRLWDQDANPIPIANADIFFISEQVQKKTIPIQSLIEDTSVSGVSPNCIAFYLRVQKFDPRAKAWIDQLAQVSDFALEITAIEPAAASHDPLIAYLPLRMPSLDAKELGSLIQPHRTTIIDVTLLRLPSPAVYQLIKS